MTNTLHRYGPPQDLKDDYIIFAMCTKGKNDIGGPEKLKSFLKICARHHPVNLGDARHGGINRPSSNLNPLTHWRRKNEGSIERVIAGLDETTTASAVFDNLKSLRDCLSEVKSADLGLSVNVAALADDVNQCSQEAGIQRQAVEYSFGFIGNRAKLPAADTLELSTMCGHGMIANTFAQKMIDWVKTGRKTPKECAGYMSRFCVCGIFNAIRAERLLNRSANR